MVLGPRLDRPSAVGDEGRPRAASLTIAAVVVVLVLLAGGFLLGNPTQLFSAGLLVGLMAAGVALLNRDRLATQVVGHLFFLPSTVLLTFLLAFRAIGALASPGQAVLVAGSLLAMVGMTTAWADVFDADAIQHALVSSAISYVLWLASLVVLFGVGLFAVMGWAFVAALTGGSGPTVALFGLLTLVAGAAASLYVAVRAIPVMQLTPVEERPAAGERYRRLRRGLGYAAVAPLALMVVLFLLLLTGVLTPVLGVLAAPLTVVASLSAVPLSVVIALSLVIALVAWGLRRATVDRDEFSTRTAAAGVAAVCYTVLIGFSIPVILLVAVSGGLAAGVIAVGPVLAYAMLAGLLLLLYLGLVPDRAGAPATTATGLIAVGIGGALLGFPSLFVFGAVAGGLVAWDVGTFGLGVTAELGHLPETRRLELYHAVFAVGLALLGIALLTGLDLARRSVAAGVGAPVAMGVAVLGALLLLLPLRG